VTACPSDDKAHLATCERCRARVGSETLQAAPPSEAIGDDAPPTLDDLDRRALKPGDRVSRYIIERELGRGGMGVVFAAEDPSLHRKIALKVMRGDDDDPKGSERMMREARAMAQLSHPNVVAIHDVGELSDSQVFLAMELVEGKTLRTLLREVKLEDKLDYYAQAGRGLAAAHAIGLVHRDFKPDNVLVGKDGRARVTDFGLVRGASLAGAGPLTRRGEVLGTPGYMAPEQHASQVATAAADQYAYAIGLYEAIVGMRPYLGNYEEIRKAKERPPAWPPRVPISTALKEAIERALQVDPAQRFPKLMELVRIVDQALGTTREAPPPPMAGPIVRKTVKMQPTPKPGVLPPPNVFSGPPPPPVSGPMPPPSVPMKSRTPLAVAALAAIALVAGGAAITWGRPLRSTNPVDPTLTPGPPPPYMSMHPGITMAETQYCPAGTNERRDDDLRWLYCHDLNEQLVGPSFRFYPNGKLALEQSYSQNKLSGMSWGFAETGGQPITIEGYKAGLLHGPRWERAPDGTVRSWEAYLDGKPKRRIEYNGELIVKDETF
jgi:serine/threonine protein kinase